MDSLSEFMANLINTSLKVIKFSYINPIIVSVHTVAFCDEYFFSQTAISPSYPSSTTYSLFIPALCRRNDFECMAQTHFWYCIHLCSRKSKIKFISRKYSQTTADC